MATLRNKRINPEKAIAELTASVTTANATAAAPAAAAPATRARRAAVAKPGVAASTPAQRNKPVNPPSEPSKDLLAFPNPTPERDYLIQFQIPEFTCHCPLTGQPDFAHFIIDMIADEHCVELKSLKMYMWSFRNEGAFHEKVTNDILDKIVAVTDPRFVRITARWYVRGGIYTNVVAQHRKKGWKPSKLDVLDATASLTPEKGLLGL